MYKTELEQLEKRFVRHLAVLLVISVVATTASLAIVTRDTRAASLTTVSDTLSDSDVGVVANHTIVFTTPTGLTAGETIAITFPAEFDITSLTHADIDIATSTDYSVGDTCGGTDAYSVPAPTTSTLVLTACAGDGGDLPANATTTIQIGLNASFGSTSLAQITNSTSTGSFLISIGGTMTDSGSLRVAIIDDVVVTASVDTSLTFTIAGLATSTDVNGATTTISTVGSSTTLPFGTLPLDTPVTLGQQLSVTTNAANGFVVTVEEDNNLLSSTGGDIDLFIDGATTSVPIEWTSPTNSVADEATWGHMGVTSEDDLNSDEFGTSTAKFAGNFNAARQVFSHTGPADGTTANIGQTDVAYRIEITALQETGNDYTNTLTYIATATF